jgi:poly(A) polymerase
LREEEDLSRLRPALDGGIRPSRAVGEALDFLMEIRLDEGEIDTDEAARRLRAWWADRGH